MDAFNREMQVDTAIPLHSACQPVRPGFNTSPCGSRAMCRVIGRRQYGTVQARIE